MSEMRTKTLIALFSCVAPAALLAGCSDEGGTPSTTSQPPTATSQPGAGLPHSGAPKVTSPIADTSKWEADPCSAISETQLSALGIEMRKFEPDLEGASGPVCDWALEPYGSFSGGFGSEVNSDGLSRVYQNKNAGKFGVFTELSPVEGHPAVRAEQRDESNEGLCSVSVGLRDDLEYSVVVTFDAENPQAKDPCKAAQDIAALAVQTMKGGA